MPQTDRELSLRIHLAEKVMGWTINEYADGKLCFAITRDGDRIRLWGPSSTMSRWSPPESWAGAGMVWEKAREDPETSERLHQELIRISHHSSQAAFGWFIRYATPCVICEAVAKATEWEDPR